MPPTVQKQMFHVTHLFGLKAPNREKRLRSPIAPPIMRPIAWPEAAQRDREARAGAPSIVRGAALDP